jgi:DNA polymerase (family 10)
MTVLGVANKVVKWLKPYSTKVMITGSIRRGNPNPKDVDIVCVPKNKGKIMVFLEKHDNFTREGNELVSLIVDGVQVDIFFTDREHWGAMIFYSTGPSGYGIGYRIRAMKMGYILNQNGLYDRATGRLVASRTEQDIYKALDKTYKPPNMRGA